MSQEPKSDKLKEVYQERTVESQRETYKHWAETYDAQTTQEFGWMGFRSAAEAFAQRVPDKLARILDAGCGTGLAGKALAQLGYANLHGRDLSPEMLAKAADLQVYQSLGECDMTQPLEEEPFDAVLCAGVFGFGPPFPEDIRHLIAITQPGGIVAVTVNGKGWEDKAWETRLPRIISQYDLDLEEQFDIDYLSKEEISGKLLVFRSC